MITFRMNKNIQIIYVFFIILPTVLALFGLIGSEQSVGITGKLKCKGLPASNVTLRLYDKDIMKDSLLVEKQLGADGVFDIKGKQREFSTIEPYLSIIHNCNLKTGCHKTINIPIPSAYVFQSSNARKSYNIETIELANTTLKFSLDCPKNQ
ncbi:Transthyretin-like family protein [Dictyocaulus viviparus]|uniref:Transthyretin-like family protein n=1 Tax=Dictyocaulus viviparus TaxID=29172 RepID=A0A0D8XVI0_DICVI|nr:Transthyretin-like family protein [Dictyocaulus viviparus]